MQVQNSGDRAKGSQFDVLTNLFQGFYIVGFLAGGSGSISPRRTAAACSPRRTRPCPPNPMASRCSARRSSVSALSRADVGRSTRPPSCRTSNDVEKFDSGRTSRGFGCGATAPLPPLSGNSLKCHANPGKLGNGSEPHPITDDQRERHRGSQPPRPPVKPFYRG